MQVQGPRKAKFKLKDLKSLLISSTGVILYKHLILPIAGGFLSFAAYLRTLLPGTGYTGDTAVFQFAGKVLGITHPPGFPTYMLLNHLFSKLPIRSLAYRINLMSALFGSLTVVLLYLIILGLTRDRLIAFICSLIFAFSRTFWSQSVVAEVYTLNAFFVASVIMSLITWVEKREIKYFYLACLTYAISFGNHLMMIALLPAFIYLIVATDYRVLLNLKNLLVTGLTQLNG